MFCSKCGAEVNPGSIFCQKCGNRIQVGAKDKTNSRKWPVFVAVGAIICLAAGALAFFFIHSRSDSKNPNSVASTEQTQQDDSGSGGNTPDGNPTESGSDLQTELTEEQKEAFSVFEDYLQENSAVDEYFLCSYLFVDEDDIPELVFDNSGDGRGMTLLCCKDGEVIASDIWARGGSVSFKEKQNYLLYDGGGDIDGQSHFYFNAGHLADGTFICDKAFEEVNYSDGTTLYQMNNYTVDKDLYEEEMEACKDDPFLIELDFTYGAPEESKNAYTTPKEAKDAFLRDKDLTESD